jgi:O-acetyl-ADP-ribose deacetylase (regulator of RNase III)
LAGSGVCGVIHRVAGPELEAACRSIGRIAVGTAVLTRAFSLPAEFVIHAVAPRFLDGNRGELDALRHTYEAICKIVTEQEIAHVSIPSLGTGIYRFPLEIASSLAVGVLREKLPENCTATIVCFDEKTAEAYKNALFK